MPISVKIPYNWGDEVYIKNDPKQSPYIFTGFYCRQGSIVYLLSDLGDEIEVYDYETSPKPDSVKKLGINKKDEDDD